MANEMKSLAKDTAIYGISSIVGKFLNYLLVPLYTHVLKQTSDYGIVTNLYAWTALLLVILTYGMETGFFRFANREGYNPQQVYKTTLLSLLITSTLFAVVCICFAQPIASVMGYAEHAEFIAMLSVVVAMDAFSCIPFAYLRYRKRPVAFAGLKLLFVFLNIALNLLFLVVLKLTDVRYVFIANFIATAVQTVVLIPMSWPDRSDKSKPSLLILKELLRYSLPLLILGVAGIMNQTLDRILFPYIYPGADAQDQLGIYGACFKVAMVMMMFTQAFRYAYEPFVFSKHKDRQSVEAYADAMKYYFIFSMLILLIVVIYLDIFKYIIGRDYWEGLRIVPIVLWTYVFQGVYFNLSFWYKLTDETRWGAYFSLIGLVITTVLQVVFVPRIGYWASCGSSLICYLVIMTLSYSIGQKKMPIPYDVKSMLNYFSLTMGLLSAYWSLDYVQINVWLKMGIGTIAIIGFLRYINKTDFPLSALPVVGKYFRK